MPNIPKLRLMLARLEKEASARWRTLQGLTALLGNTAERWPRLGALQLAAAKQNLKLPGEGFSKALSDLPAGPIGKLGLLPPSQVFRGVTTPSGLQSSGVGYSKDYLHASPFKEVAKEHASVPQPYLGPMVHQPKSLIGVYDTIKNQKYAPNFGFESNKGVGYLAAKLQDLFRGSPTPLKSQIYETMVQPSQLQSVLLNNRVLPATAKGRELLQTGTMPAGAKLPPEILKSATELDKEAGIADIANRVLSTLIKSPITPSFVKNTFYPGFPAVREALRATGRVKTVVPSTGVGDIPTFAVRGENSPAFKALRSQFKTMVPENQTPEGVFDKITTEMSGTPLQRTYSGWVAKNQAKADLKHEPWGEIYTPPGAHYRSNTNNVVNFTPNNTKFMRHELTHGLQFQLPNNFNSLHTLSTGTKLPVPFKSGWTTVRGTAAPNRSNFLMEMNANAAMSRTPLGQIREAISFATDPWRARYYAPKYTPTEKWVHDTLSFPRDIPRRVKAMPGQLMDWIDSKILPPNLTKGAGVTKEELPWRDRVEVYTQNPKGKIYGGIWDNDKSFALPGGGIDEGEDPLLAALRELKEETGINAKNPRLLPIDPVDSPWSDAHRAKIKRNFAGSRTHFVLADAMSRRGNKNLDVWNASNRGYYTPAKAIDIMNSNTNYMAPTAAAARLKALQYIQSLAMAAAKEKSAGVTKEELIHAYKANDPAMRILSQGPVTDKDFLYHASGKKFDALDPKYNSKRSYGHEYTEPVVFAGDAPSSAFASNPTAEYQAVKDKMKDSVYHRLIDELTGRKALLGHTPGGYLYKLPASAFTRIDREDNELGKWNKSTEYVSHRPVKPISVTPMQSTDVDAIPEYEYLGKDFVGEMPAQHYLKHAKNPKVIAAIQAWLANKQEKEAGVFTASGNKVQGVGLRKLYHSLLDERGLTGLGVNNEDTGDVELSFDGDEVRRKEVFKELAARIRAKTNHPVTFAPTTVPQTSTPVKLSNKDSERLNAIHHLAYRMSNMYDPADPLMDPNDTFKQKLADRFRLQVNKRGLTGTVPSRAAEQLLGTRPMYAGMMPARRTRSEAEALSDMPMEQQQRLFKALKSGRGFLAPVVDKLASAAVEAPMNIYSYIPSNSIEHVKKHGLLSGNELAKPENRHLLDIARPKGDADRWLKERDARMLKSPWTNSYNGPSAFFGDIDAEKIHDKHPIKKFETTRAVIKLRELLRDYPATKMEGSELIPFSATTYDALDEKGRNEFVNKRHHTLSLDEIKALLTRGQNPKDMWKDFKDTEGKYYASDVPHAQVVTPMGKIPSKYIKFGEADMGKDAVGFSVPDDVLTKHANLARLGMAAAKGLYGLGSAAVKSPVAQNIATGARNAGSSLYAKANDLTNAAIQSPITPDFIKNTFKPGYAAVRSALKRTGRSWAPDYSKASPPFKSVMKPTATSPDSAHRLWTTDTTLTPFAMPGQGGAYYPKANLATSSFPKGTENGMRFMRHELAHGLQFQMPQPIAGGLNSLHTASKGSGNIFLQELNANAAMSRTPLGQMGRAIGFATNPVQLANYWQQYKPIDKLMHGAAAAVLPTAFGARTYAGGYLSPTPKDTLANQDEEINPSPDDVLTKHANLARLGMAAAKGLYGLGSAAVKSPIAQNIATGAGNLVNRAGNLANTAVQSPMAQNIATRAGNLVNSAVQSRAGKTLITGAEKLHEGTVNLANRAIQNPIVSRLYAGANDLTNAAIQSPMTPDFIKNTFKPGYEAGRQALRRTSRQWVPNWDEPTKGFRLMPKQPVSSSPDRVFRQYKVETTPLMPPSTNGVYWTGGRNQISVRGPRGTESGMRVMRHELTHGLQHQLPSNFNSLQTASVNSPFAGSFLREMNANAAMSRTPLGQMGRAIGYATSPERLKAYWDGYKPMDKLMHGAAVGTAYGVPLAAATVAGGVGTYEGLHSLASRMQPTNLPHNPEFAQAGPPNLNTEESFPEEVA